MAAGNDAAGDLVVRRQASFREAAVVGADHALVEVGDVHYVGPDVFEPQFSKEPFASLASPCLHHPQRRVGSSAAAVASITSRGTSITSW